MALKTKYPKVNCNEITDGYKGRPSAFEFDSVAEFKLNSEAELVGEETHFTGVMQCFCLDQQNQGKKQKGIISTHWNRRISHVRGAHLFGVF